VEPESRTQASSAAEPRQFGPYLLLRELGRGAQGTVYLAEDVRLHRKVALKLLSGAAAQSPEMRERFRREAELASKLEHPGVCGVHELGEVEGVPYIAMQYVQGVTLADLLAKARERSDSAGAAGALSLTASGSKGDLQDLVRLLEHAARALHVAHEAGLVHRDVKPGNIMVTPDGQPVLLDFGLARDVSGEAHVLTQSGQILGTPAYLAPEQIVSTRGAIDRRTDVRALGVTLFECLTLRRPFEGASWDKLFHAILHGDPPNLHTINARIPRDLCTVVEVALERDPARRYATAEAFADDLRRVRSFEPIRAKAAGPVARLRKWARRRPGYAVAAVAAVAFVVAGATALAAQSIGRYRTVRRYLHEAEAHLAAGDYQAALEAETRAHERDPDSARALELEAQIRAAIAKANEDERRGEDTAAAGEARREASALRERYLEARRAIVEREAELLRERAGVFGQFTADGDRAAYARKEREVDALRMDAERTLADWESALQRAARREARWGDTSAETEGALADFFIERWREAVSANAGARASVLRTAVERHDRDGRHRAELLGRGTLTVLASAPAVELYLFRYESHDSLRPDGALPRLVPVPTSGIGRAKDGAWCDDFYPGDRCLSIAGVLPGSIAEREGLRAGDLIVRVGGAPCASGVRVRSMRAADGAPGIAPLDCVVALDGVPVDSVFDWIALAGTGASGSRRLRLDRSAREIECDPGAIEVVSASELVASGGPVEMQIDCLRGGELAQVRVPPQTSLGVECEPTAYPLVCAPANRIAAGEPVTVDPGSYLVLARAEGFEELRVAVFVARLANVTANAELLPAGSLPPGFVYIPPGPFVAGGDPDAFLPRSRGTLDVAGFAIARTEVTNREWYEFVNDSETLARLASASAGANLPRDDRVLAKRRADGTGFTWDVHRFTAAETPVLGLAWTDVRDFLAWRNRKAVEQGEPWRYDLPTEAEWEKAARGADGRAFPWGDRFDPALAVCMIRRPYYLLDAPGGYERADESPYGVLDMAGSREEWLRDAVEGSDPPRYRKRGGHWGSMVENLFRAAGRGEASVDHAASSQGFRLVARPR
jgi:formylglycine-generating enzyme required for sulfatase activity